MTERSHGYKYAEQEGKSTADIAKLMRRDIKQAIADGLLPGAPVKYSVRIETYSGGASIGITVQGWTEAWQDCDGFRGHEPVVAGRGRDLCRNHFCAAALAMSNETRPGAEVHQKLTAEADAANMTLERIHGAYNHNGSDAMVDHFDVNYYGGVTFESARGAKWRADEEAKRAAKRAKVDELAAVETVRVVVYGSARKRTVHDAAQRGGNYLPVCGAVLWRSSVVGPAAADAELTCTRCKKHADKRAASAREPVPAVAPVKQTFEVVRVLGGPVSSIRMAVAPGVDASGVARILSAMFSGATHYRPAGGAEWLPIERGQQ